MATDRVVWSIERAGQVIAFDPTQPNNYFKAAGMTGTGVAPTTLTIAGAVSGGGTFRRSRREIRQVVLPVITFGVNMTDVESKLRALIRLLDDSYDSPTLVATYPSGERFTTECHYAGGADHQWGSSDTDGQTYCKWVLQLTCPDPFFTSQRSTQFRVGNTGGRGLLRTPGSLTQLRLTSSQSLGSITVVNGGDVEAWPTWRVQGPGSALVATRPVDGASFTLATQFVASNPVTIDTRTKAVTDSTGANRYGGMVGAPKLFSLPPGQTTVGVALLDADATSVVTMSFQERRELVF